MCADRPHSSSTWPTSWSTSGMSRPASTPSASDRQEVEMEGELHTDGNGVAGLLQEVFLVEVTTAHRVCQSCRAERPVGAHRAYAGAGVVLRCPNCGDVAAVIAAPPDRRVVELRGTWIVPTSG